MDGESPDLTTPGFAMPKSVVDSIHMNDNEEPRIEQPTVPIRVWGQGAGKLIIRENFDDPLPAEIQLHFEPSPKMIVE